MNEWIDIAEQLPPQSKETPGRSDWVACLTKGKFIYVDCYLFHKKTFQNELRFSKVIAWYPIPAKKEFLEKKGIK